MGCWVEQCCMMLEGKSKKFVDDIKKDALFSMCKNKQCTMAHRKWIFCLYYILHMQLKGKKHHVVIM